MTTPLPQRMLMHRGFRALFLAQLLGAFNDNLLKVVVSLLAVEAAALGHSGGNLSLVSVVFMAPYLLFSGYAGWAADFFSKRRVLIAVKAGEIATMLVAFAALIWGRVDLLLVVMFLLGTEATFFSPAKYGIVPEMLAEGALPSANGLLELSRYGAVILGTALGGVVLLRFSDRPAVLGSILLAIAAAGFVASLSISQVPRSCRDKRFRLNPWREVASGLRRLAGDAGLTSTVLGISLTEFMGALILLDLLLVGKETMGLSDGRTSLLGAFAGIGIGIGSVAAGKLSRGRVEIGLVPFGGAGMGLAALALPFAAVSYPAMAAVLVLLGFAGGLVIVPLYSALQKQAGDDERGHLVATNNFINMTAVVLASAALWLLRDVLQIPPLGVLQVGGATTLASTLCAMRCFPAYAASAARWAQSSFRRLAIVVLAPPLAVAAFGIPSAQAQDEPRTLVFRVKHQIFGEVGTVTVEIRREGALTDVRTAIDLRATAFGITLKRMRGECREQWDRGQLLSFAGAIDADGEIEETRAFFDGAHMVVDAHGARVIAPPGMQPAIPWSSRFTAATTILSPESGRIAALEVVDLGEERVSLGSETIPARHYLIRAGGDQHVYFDRTGTPLKLVFEHSTGSVTLIRAEPRVVADGSVGRALRPGRDTP